MMRSTSDEQGMSITGISRQLKHLTERAIRLVTSEDLPSCVLYAVPIIYLTLALISPVTST